jgi:hypothetical protein
MAEMNLGLGGSNPYVMNQAKALQAASNQNLQQNILPGIGQGAQAAGMYGSSRQGIAQGQAIGNAQTGLDSATANLYANAYGQDQNATLQREGMANQMSVANMNNATQNKSLDNQFNLGMGQLDSNNAQFGANFGLQSQNYQNQWANNNVNAANQMAQTPWQQFSNGAGMANQIAGQGGSTSQTNQGNPWLGGLGGMQIGNAIWGKP